MSMFLRLLDEVDKEISLQSAISTLRSGCVLNSAYEVDPRSFKKIPTTPFAYWVSERVRSVFEQIPPLKSHGREAWMGLSTGANFQWLRLPWEILADRIVQTRAESRSQRRWAYVAKGGEYASFYQKFHVLVDWSNDGGRLESWKQAELSMGRTSENNSQCWNKTKYFRPGVTWSARSQKGASFRALSPNCIFGSKGPAIVVDDDSHESLLAIIAVSNSQVFGLLLSMQMAFGSFEVGVIQRTPIPNWNSKQQCDLAALAQEAWSLKYNLDTVDETSLAFLLPHALRSRLSAYDPSSSEEQLTHLQAKIEGIAFELYELSDADRDATQNDMTSTGDQADGNDTDDDSDEEESADSIDLTAGILSWALGVAFGRFDFRLATGERTAPPEPNPFDPLPANSPGVLPLGADPFHVHGGILVDDSGHKHDLAGLIEGVLTRVDAPVPSDVRRWLQREFFPFHLQRYSKSRRKAPIYWPVPAASGGYTLWLYYPDLNSQTLFSAVNDFIEPKLEQLGKEVYALRNKGSARSRDDDKAMEALQTLEKDLIELRETLLQIAPTFRPNHDDGIQITAAPLWPLFRHKPWQKLLKETWAKLEKGDYDWTNLAIAYWPDRVREKCKTDKSLAIIHRLEELYEPPTESTTGSAHGGRKRRRAAQ